MGELLHGGLRRKMVKLRHFGRFFVFLGHSGTSNHLETHILLNLGVFSSILGRLLSVLSENSCIHLFSAKSTISGVFGLKIVVFCLPDSFF